MTINLNPILIIGIPIIFLSACGSGQLAPVDLISAKYQSSDNKLTSVNLIDYSQWKSSNFPEDLSELQTLQTSGNLFLGFSGFLDGNSIETIKYNNKNNIVLGFEPIAGIIEIAVCNWFGKNCQNFTNFNTNYRPEGGYIPPSDTPISNFPPPALQVQFSLKQPLPTNSVVVVSLIAGKIKNPDQVVMQPQLYSGSGFVTSLMTHSPVSGSVWFKTKPLEIISAQYQQSPAQQVVLQFNGVLASTPSASNFSIDGGLDVKSVSQDSSNTQAILALNQTPTPGQIYHISVTGLGIGSTQFTVSGD